MLFLPAVRSNVDRMHRRQAPPDHVYCSYCGIASWAYDYLGSSSTIKGALSLIGLQSRFGDKPVKF